MTLREMRLLAIAALIVGAAVEAAAQDFPNDDANPEQLAESLDVFPLKEKRGGDFIGLPIPFSNPTYGGGLAVGAAYLYDLDAASPTSFTGLGGFLTSNDSRGAGLVQNANFSKGRIRLRLGLGTAKLNYDFFGIGDDAGDRGIAIPVQDAKRTLVLEGSFAIGADFYLGPHYKIARNKTRVRTGEIDRPLPADAPASPEADQTVASLGAILKYDTRDDTFGPRRGWLVELEAIFNDPAFGSDFTYQTLNAKANYYHALSDNQVLAARAFACAVDGAAPFFELCQLGRKSDIRGYPGGRYRDKTLFAFQAEYRWQFADKLGAVAFLGAGGVAPRLRDIDGADLLPSYGIGLRYMVSKEYNANLSIDYARGKDSDAIYLRVGEAF